MSSLILPAHKFFFILANCPSLSIHWTRGGQKYETMTDNWEGKGLYSLHLLFEMNYYIFLKASLAKTWGGHTMCPPPNHPPEWNRVNDKCKTDKSGEGGTKQCCLYLVLEPPVTQPPLPSSQPAHTLMPSRALWNNVPIKGITQYIIHYR